MSRHLLILRHAKSAWDTNAPRDFERPLAKRGLRDAPRVGRRLRKQRLVPDYVVSSPAERAKQTAVKVCNELGIKKKKINWNRRIYAGSGRTLLKVVRKTPARVNTLMLVGHNPGVDELLAYLCGAKTKIPKYAEPLPTAAVAHLEIPADWKKLKTGSARLAAIARPT